MAFTALIFDPSTGNCLGPHFYAEQPAELPVNEIACTAAQAQNAAGWKVSNGALVSVPAPAPSLTQQLAPTDYQMARATEDLIPLLLTKGVLKTTDLDPAVLDNINARRKIRGQTTI